MRRELKDWFSRNAPHLGELYEAALRIIYSDSFPAKRYLACHAIREIANRLPDEIAGKESGRVDYHFRLDEIAKIWTPLETSPLEAQSPNSSRDPTEFILSKKLYIKVNDLVQEHLIARERANGKVNRLFLALAPENKKMQTELEPVALQYKKNLDWFVNKSHADAAVSEDDHVELKKRFEIFETTLSAFIRGFFKSKRELDEILEETNG